MSLRHTAALIAAFAAGTAAVSASAADMASSRSAVTQPRSEVGTLTCDFAPSIGVIIGSRQDLDCVFKPAHRGAPVERYTGQITKIGVDLGFYNGGQLAWAVWAPTVRPEGALRGSYVGASANATIGLGIGTNILTGGTWKNVSLQPISIQGQKGLNVAVGLSNFRLKYQG
ncbi:DUF992 domain-containing protein [Pseudochrobactrum sp. MP213Fo]|uniref:DUF992 domain-containing protein n=1 Tax=Pseudochrobactrum sp. MP213Fo TaxID=3022250 RepID=UPI003BA03527